MSEDEVVYVRLDTTVVEMDEGEPRLLVEVVNEETGRVGDMFVMVPDYEEEGED